MGFDEIEHRTLRILAMNLGHEHTDWDHSERWRLPV
jgi:hypothetical protein